MNFSIDMFGFDILPGENVYGVWFGRYENKESEIKCFLCLHYSNGDWRVDVLWHRFV
jgi:hypothetical protein